MSSKTDCDRTERSRPIPVATSKSSRVPVQSIAVERIEVAVHKTCEQYRTSQTDKNASPTSGEESLCDNLKPAGLGLSYGVERGTESGT